MSHLLIDNAAELGSEEDDEDFDDEEGEDQRKKPRADAGLDDSSEEDDEDDDEEEARKVYNPMEQTRWTRVANECSIRYAKASSWTRMKMRTREIAPPNVARSASDGGATKRRPFLMTRISTLLGKQIQT
jgi:hypothetical protein